MKAYLLLTLLFSQLLWWDLLDKIAITYRWAVARSFIDMTITWRARRLFAIARLVTGIKLKLERDSPDLPSEMLLIANHQSVIDIVGLLAAFDDHSLRFVAKKELGNWFPAVSRVLRVQRHALISRSGDFGPAMREIDHLGKRLGPGICPVIFPEGTRSRDGEVKPFHSGAVRRLHKAKTLPLVAVAIDGGWRFAGMQDLARLPYGHEYRVAVVQVYPVVRSKTELIDQIADAQRRIIETVDRWRRIQRDS